MAESRVAGRYRLLEHIGEGGMGIVWRAHDELLDRVVAVKEVRYRGVDEAARTDLNRRTIREARTAGRLDHPSVIIVHDVVEEDGRPWIVMQLVRSRSLGEIVRSGGPLPPERVASVGLHVLGALRAAHAAGVLHRDVKPENVLLADDGRVVLTDFGIASMTQETGITRTGAMVGTPAFLPPERLHGMPATPESDLWSLGATLYAALEGRPPFERATAAATMMAVLHGEPSPMSRSGPLSTAILGLLARDPAARMVPEQAEVLLGRAASPGSPASPGPHSGQRAYGSGFQTDPPRTDPSPLQDAWRPVYGDSPGGPGQPRHPAAHTPPEHFPSTARPHSEHSPYTAGGPQPEQARPSVAHPRPEQPPYAQQPYTHPGHSSSAPPDPYTHPGLPPYTHPDPYTHPGQSSYTHPEQQVYAYHEQPRHARPEQRAYGSEPWTRREQPTDTGAAPARLTGARRLALLAGVPALAVTVGVGAWLVLRNPGTPVDTGGRAGVTALITDPTPATSPEATPTRDATPTATPRPSRIIPSGWRLHRDPMGFSIAVPGNWQVKRFSGRDRVEFRAPGASDSFLWIESTEDPEKDPERHWEKVERAGVAENVWPGYRRVSITALTYQGVPAADWEFTYLKNGVRTRVLDRGFRTRDGKPYAIYWESPDARRSGSLFAAFTNTFRP
ncbi:protein kinase [Streptosporangium sp. NPDC050280]|uniref:serine/threonine-protein kinase n=1 Tax=unclassified Streptosporangium TaxID=2632669 RepID=UPI0034421A34